MMKYTIQLGEFSRNHGNFTSCISFHFTTSVLKLGNLETRHDFLALSTEFLGFQTLALEKKIPSSCYESRGCLEVVITSYTSLRLHIKIPEPNATLVLNRLL